LLIESVRNHKYFPIMVYKVPENLPYIPKKKYGNYIGKTVVNNFMQTGVNESM